MLDRLMRRLFTSLGGPSVSSPVCTACDVERRLIHLAPIAGHYQIRSFKCPLCNHVLHLVAHESERVPVYGVPEQLILGNEIAASQLLQRSVPDDTLKIVLRDDETAA